MATPFLSAELRVAIGTAGKPSGGLRNGGFIARTFASQCRAPMGQHSATGEVRHRLRLVVPTDGEAYGLSGSPTNHRRSRFPSRLAQQSAFIVIGTILSALLRLAETVASAQPRRTVQTALSQTVWRSK